MKELNILMLGGAKRVSMGRMLIEAVRRLGYSASLVSYELESRVPVGIIADIVVGRRWSDPDVVDDLCRLCRERRIDIVVPFVDGAVEIAARLAASADRVFAPVSAPDLCRRMFDKVEADHLFRLLGFPLPASASLPHVLPFPVIAKPRMGSASKGIIILHSAADSAAIANTDDYLFQEYIADRQEITVDCYVAQNGTVYAVVPRLRLEVVGGEASRTVTIDNPSLVGLCHEILGALQLHGAVTLQFLREKASGRTMLMEINPRLGGGAVCSVHAGADIPAMIVSEWAGTGIAPASYRPGTEIARYMQEVVFFNDEKNVKQ